MNALHFFILFYYLFIYWYLHLEIAPETSQGGKFAETTRMKTQASFWLHYRKTTRQAQPTTSAK